MTHGSCILKICRCLTEQTEPTMTDLLLRNAMVLQIETDGSRAHILH
ncbi:MAG: hypothetical protein IH587_01180, partial [Anaerolineae bacterium]|nr:hypothetical protein [Anaerolineae bacterium]